MVIPDGWKEVRLGDLGSTYGGLTGKSARDFDTGNVHYVTFMNVISNVVLSESGIGLVEVRPDEAQSQLRTGDIIFNGSSETPDEVGMGAAVPEGLEGAYLNSFCFGFRRNADAGLSARFFSYLSRSAYGRAVIRPMAQGSTRYNLAKSSLLNGRFLLPPLREQEAIAEALSDADALIESLDALIAKKRDMRTAAIQRLLTPTSEWRACSIDEVALRTSGFWGRSQPSSEDIETGVIRVGDISAEGKLVGCATRYLSPREMAQSEVVAQDVVITSSGNLGKTWCSDGRGPLAASNFVRRLRPNPTTIVGTFLSSVLQSGPGLRALDAHTATTAYPNLMNSFFREQWFSIPPLDIQLEICELLVSLDEEIDATVRLREKASLVKQGMMQELLTGRVRLT